MKRLFCALVITYCAAPIGNAGGSHDWRGLYSGVSLNYSDGATTVTGNRFTYDQSQAVNLVEHDYQGGALGGFVGWNWQKEALIFGGEISLGIGSLKSNLVFNPDDDIDQVEMDIYGSIVGRIGYAFGNSNIYAKSGLAFANIRNVGGDVDGGTLDLLDAHMREEITFGPTIGLGLESSVAHDWLIRIEANFTDFETYSQANQQGAAGSQVYQISNGPLRTVGIGLVYEF